MLSSFLGSWKRKQRQRTADSELNERRFKQEGKEDWGGAAINPVFRSCRALEGVVGFPSVRFLNPNRGSLLRFPNHCTFRQTQYIVHVHSTLLYEGQFDEVEEAIATEF